jgi:hypothetical protein
MDSTILRERAWKVATLRRELSNPEELHRRAGGVLDRTPLSCQVLVAFSNEGYAIGVAAACLAFRRGRRLEIHRASLLRPLAPACEVPGWSWMNVEEALGLGPVRSWVRGWADERGAGRRLPPMNRSESEVA